MTDANFGAKDVQTLRQQTGAGMMDAKRALTETGGIMEDAARWLREKGLAQSQKRSDRAAESQRDHNHDRQSSHVDLSLWRGGDRQNTGHLPTLRRLQQHLVHQESGRRRRLARRPDGERDGHVDLRGLLAEQGDPELRHRGLDVRNG